MTLTGIGCLLVSAPAFERMYDRIFIKPVNLNLRQYFSAFAHFPLRELYALAVHTNYYLFQGSKFNRAVFEVEDQTTGFCPTGA